MGLLDVDKLRIKDRDRIKDQGSIGLRKSLLLRAKLRSTSLRDREAKIESVFLHGQASKSQALQLSPFFPIWFLESTLPMNLSPFYQILLVSLYVAYFLPLCTSDNSALNISYSGHDFFI